MITAEEARKVSESSLEQRVIAAEVDANRAIDKACQLGEVSVDFEGDGAVLQALKPRLEVRGFGCRYISASEQAVLIRFDRKEAPADLRARLIIRW